MARGSMSNLDVSVWVRRADSLLGYRVDNIYTAGESLLLKFRTVEGPKFLAIEEGVRIHLTSRTSGVSEASRGFPSYLKRFIRDEKLTGVEQMGFDRVLELSFSNNTSLYVELLPRGVIVLVNENNIILSASRYAEMRDRIIKAGIEYRPPPLQVLNPFTLETKDIALKAGVGSDIVRGLIRGLGLPGEVAEEVLYRAGINPGFDPKSLDPSVYETIKEELLGIYNESLEGRGYLVLREEAPLEATPFKPRRFPEATVLEFNTFDEALDELFSRRHAQARSLIEEEERVKLERSLGEARELEARYLEEAKAGRLAAEILSRNYEFVESIVECVVRMWRHRDLSICKAVTEADFHNGVYVIEVENAKIKLRYGERVQEAIVRLYREAGELEGKAERAGKAEEQALAKIEELELKAKARLVAEKASSRRVAWFERFRWTITRNGFLVIGGRDASQNESLVRRYLNDNDIFLHADIHGGSTVILKTRGVKPGGDDIMEAAIIAACYSKAWKAGFASIDVYWTYGYQVSKRAPPGEYLKTGAFMIYGERNYLRGVKLELPLGLVLDTGGNPLLMTGSEEVIRKASIAYVILAPGDNSVDEAEVIKDRLVKILDSDLKPLAMGLDASKIKDMLPGRFKVLKAARGEGAGVDLESY